MHELQELTAGFNAPLPSQKGYTLRPLAFRGNGQVRQFLKKSESNIKRVTPQPDPPDGGGGGGGGPPIGNGRLWAMAGN